MNKTHYEKLVNKISNKMEKMSPSELDREIEESKKELIDMGLLEPAGRDLRGEVIYRQSAKGKRVVEELKAIG